MCWNAFTSSAPVTVQTGGAAAAFAGVGALRFFLFGMVKSAPAPLSIVASLEPTATKFEIYESTSETEKSSFPPFEVVSSVFCYILQSTASSYIQLQLPGATLSAKDEDTENHNGEAG